MQQKEMAQPASVSIGAKIADAEAAQIRELIEAGVYLNESDFMEMRSGIDIENVKAVIIKKLKYVTTSSTVIKCPLFDVLTLAA